MGQVHGVITDRALQLGYRELSDVRVCDVTQTATGIKPAMPTFKGAPFGMPERAQLEERLAFHVLRANTRVWGERWTVGDASVLELTNADQLAAARALPSGQYLDLAKVDGAPLSFVAADIAAAKAIREELRRLDEEAAILATEDAFAEDEARAAATARLATYYTDLVPLLRAVEAGGIEEARAFLKRIADANALVQAADAAAAKIEKHHAAACADAELLERPAPPDPLADGLGPPQA